MKTKILVALVAALALAGCASVPTEAEIKAAADHFVDQCSVVAIGASYGQEAVESFMELEEFDERLAALQLDPGLGEEEKQLLSRGIIWQYKHGIVGTSEAFATLIGFDYCLAGKIPLEGKIQ